MHSLEPVSDALIHVRRPHARQAPFPRHIEPRRLGRIATRALATLALLTMAGVAPGYSQSVDPPGFAAVSLKGTQIIRLNVVCFDHHVGNLPPNPCRGEVMFHDGSGREIKREPYDLQPGQTTFLQLAIPATNAAGEPIRRVTIIPCLIPAPGGRAIPSVEVLDRDAGRVILFENPAAARMSEFNNSPNDTPGSLGGFDPQPDPPGFGLVTLRSDQGVRMNVACFDHAINGVPPSPCQGVVLVHDAAGNVLRRGAYELGPGQTRSFDFAPQATRTGTLSGIVPCIIPAPGGRAVPNVEVMDSAGNVVLLINPAAARMSQFQHQEDPR